MALPEIAQNTYLADTLQYFVNGKAINSVAVIGCAGGNGFDRLAAVNIRRVVGVDVSPDYLAAAKHRYLGRFTCLELICADLSSEECCYDPTDLAFAALIFEYVDVAASLASLRRLVHPGGRVLTVLQLPHPGLAAVTPSPFASLSRLAPLLRLVEPAQFQEEAARVGFDVVSSLRRVLPSGKAFQEVLLR